MTTKHFLVSGIALLLLTTACNKEVDELPGATDTGANTFGAKVNGAYWVPARFGILPADNLLRAWFTSPESIMIKANNFSQSPTETGFEIQIGGVDGPGTYYLNQNISKPTAAGYGYYVKRTFTPTGEWQTSTHYTGTVTITKLDYANKIVAGTFEFTAGSLTGSGESISVTDGRFDIKYE